MWIGLRGHGIRRQLSRGKKGCSSTGHRGSGFPTLVRHQICANTPQTLQHRNISSHTVISLLGCPPPAGLIGYQMAHHKGSRFLALDRVLARLKRTGGAGPQSISEKQYPHRFWANAPEMVYDHPSRRPGSH